MSTARLTPKADAITRRRMRRLPAPSERTSDGMGPDTLKELVDRLQSPYWPAAINALMLTATISQADTRALTAMTLEATSRRLL